MKYFGLLSVLLLGACGSLQQEQPASPPPPEQPPVVMEKNKEIVDSIGSPQVEMTDDEKKADAGGKGAYINARDDVSLASNAIGNGDPALLFFHATWCGYCQAKDKVLAKLYSENSFSVSTYKVDYDTVNDLKARYGITTQDTVVLVDGSGNAVQTVIGATEGDLRNLLSSS